MRLNTIALFAAALLMQSATIASEVIENAMAPNICFETVDNGQFCTSDNLGKIQVFVFNAGWCPPCNSEIHDLSKGYSQYAGKPVVFASLSGEGFQHGSKPDKTFLEGWKAKHNIPFVVAGKYKEFGKTYGASGSIPFTAIVDAEGKIVAKGNLGPSTVYSKVNELLSGESSGSCLPDIE